MRYGDDLDWCSTHHDHPFDGSGNEDGTYLPITRTSPPSAASHLNAEDEDEDEEGEEEEDRPPPGSLPPATATVEPSPEEVKRIQERDCAVATVRVQEKKRARSEATANMTAQDRRAYNVFDEIRAQGQEAAQLEEGRVQDAADSIRRQRASGEGVKGGGS
jgi:hypothetical protein